MKVLMVCLGNICRSPLAQGILEARAREAGLNWEVDSAGTMHYHVNEPPHIQSQKTAQKNGIDISAQRCRQFLASDFDSFDRIYVMDKSNFKTLLNQIPNISYQSKISLITDFYGKKGSEVPDPYYGNLNEFRNVYNMLDEICEQIALDFYQKR